MHRITLWRDDDGNVVQASLACLDHDWEPQAEVVVPVGPFDTLEERLEAAADEAHRLGGWRAHQQILEFG